MGSWGKIGVQRDFWVKNGVLGKWACKGTFGVKRSVGEMGMQKDFWGENGVLGKWLCKETFGLKMGL